MTRQKSLPVPRALGLTIKKITPTLVKGKDALWVQLRLYWRDIVGERWAQKTVPERLIFPNERQPCGILHVGVWGGDRLACAYDAGYLCEKVNQYLGFGAVHSIKWRTLSAPPYVSATEKNAVIVPHVLNEHDTQWLEGHIDCLEGPLQKACHGLGESLLKSSQIPFRKKR